MQRIAATFALMATLSLASTDAESADIEKQEMRKFLGEDNPPRDLDSDSDSDSGSGSDSDSGDDSDDDSGDESALSQNLTSNGKKKKFNVFADVNFDDGGDATAVSGSFLLH